ncbi:hypothetical protein MASR1M36_11950 [Candidatus Cloacimonadaceae bacterium]
MDDELVPIGCNIIMGGIIMSGVFFFVYFGEAEPFATTVKKAMIPTVIAVAIAVGIWISVFISIQTAKHRIAKLKKELELRRSEREQIDDKMNSLLRKLGDWPYVVNPD